LRTYTPNFEERNESSGARDKGLFERENQYFQSTYLFKYINIMNGVKFIPRKDEDFLRCSLRKLKHTVNKVLSLIDLAWSGSDRLRTLKHAVNKVSPLWSFTGNRQSRQGKPRRGNALLIRRQAYPVNNPRIYPGVNVAFPQMNAGGVTLYRK
jgi:hypothetical protein